MGRSLAFSTLGKHEEANDCFDKAIKIEPQDKKALLAKAENLEKWGKISEAIKAYKDYIKFASPLYPGEHCKAEERIRELEEKIRQK